MKRRITYKAGIVTFVLCLLIKFGNAQYCSPAYTGGSGFGDYISHVKLDSIDNATGASGSPYYTFYNSQTTTLNIGSTHWIYIKPGTYYKGNSIAIWIDYNQNDTFEKGEKVGEKSAIKGTTWDSISFTIPNYADSGITRMRVREVYNKPAMDPCTTYDYGEVEDYQVTIKYMQCTQPPTAGFAYTPFNELCVNDTFYLYAIGYTLGGGLTQQWQSSSDSITWTNINSANDIILRQSFTNDIYYRYYVHCGSGSDTSLAVKIYTKPALLCYCQASHGNICSSVDFAIKQVSIEGTTLFNEPMPCVDTIPYDQYLDTGNYTATLMRGNYKLTVLTDSSTTVATWLDVDRNGQFDNDEWTPLYLPLLMVGQKTGSSTVNLNVPYSAVSGRTGFRVRSKSGFSNNLPSYGCVKFYSGHSEDYIVTIADPIPQDIGVFELQSPSGLGCFTNGEKLEISIINAGSDTIDFSKKNAVLTAEMSGGNIATLDTTLVSGILAPGDQMYIIMPDSVDMSITNIDYNFKIYINMAGDANPYDDTTETYIRSSKTEVAPALYDFNSTYATPYSFWGYGFSIYDLNGDGVLVTDSTTNTSGSYASSPIIGPLTNISAIRFEYSSKAPLDIDDSVVAEISVDCGKTFNTLYTITSTNSDSNSVHPIQISLGANAGNYMIVRLISYYQSLAGVPIMFNNLAVGDIPQISLGNDTSLCAAKLKLKTNRNGQAWTLEWQGGQNYNEDTLTVKTGSSTWVKATDDVTFMVNYDTIKVSAKSLAVNLGADQYICAGKQVILDAGNWNGYQFLWSTGAKTNTILAKTPGIYICTVKGGSCSGTDTVELLKVDKPQGVSFIKGSSFTGAWKQGTLTDPDDICNSAQAQYEITPPSNYQNTDYTTRWKITTSSIITLNGTAAPASHWSVATPTVQLNALVQFNPGKVEEDSIYILSASITDLVSGCDTIIKRYIHITPQLDVQLSPVLTACVGQVITLDAGVKGRYLWSTKDTTQTINVTSSGIYKVKVNNEAGCYAEDSVPISYFPKADASFTYTFQSGAYQFQATDQNHQSYLWHFGDGDTSTQINPVHIFTNNATSKVQLNIVTKQQCADSSEQTIQLQIGVATPESISWMRVVPNPYESNAELKYQLNQAAQSEINLYDITGKYIKNIYKGAQGVGAHSIPISTPNAGTYILRIEISGNASFIKIINLVTP
jgi:hypothetical protein